MQRILKSQATERILDFSLSFWERAGVRVQQRKPRPPLPVFSRTESVPVPVVKFRSAFFYAILVLALLPCHSATAETAGGLIAHWPLAGDGRDVSGNGLHATPHAIDFGVAGPSPHFAKSAGFDGQTSRLVVPPSKLLELGRDDFTVSARVFTTGAGDDVPGDIISQYDASARRGFHLGLKTNAGVTFSQANLCQLQFAIDQNRAINEWTDCGRPGNALLAFALCVFEGKLYAGTCEPGKDETGHVYRYDGGQTWTDCGSPDQSNSVTALAEFDGQLYAGTGKYRVAGSALPESENATLGGRVFRLEPPARWVDCGQLPQTECCGGLCVFKNKLYAASLYKPAGFFRYDGERQWTTCDVPHVSSPQSPAQATAVRVEAIAPYSGALYATSYDGGRVFRFDGQHWTDCGQLGDNTQTYSLAISAGQLYVGTWPSGKVYRFAGLNQWTDVGRLGEELEVMGMLVHNGRLIGGTLPLAEVYQFDGRTGWEKLARLDHTPDVRYRRAWCLAEYRGQVFCSTLPSGKIYSWRAGRVAMADRALPGGWHHVAAVRNGSTLKIVVDGRQTAEENGFQAADFDLTIDQPLQIGFGPNNHFQGRLSDVRLYRRALSVDELAQLAK